MKRFLLLAALTLGLSACGGGVPEEYMGDDVREDIVMEGGEGENGIKGEDIEVDERDERGFMETKNVSYEGIVRPSGISIYMQGTHRLETEMDTVLLLESETIDLEKYTAKNVRVFGSVRPTVEEGGMIMRVERVEVTNEEEAKEAKESKESKESPVNDDEESEDDEDLAIQQQSSESAEEEEGQEAEDVKDSKDSKETEMRSSSVSASPPDSEKVTMMSDEKFGDEEWTQRYCSLHIGFCIPIHRNWWYKSFGATTSSLWHIEIGPEAVEVLGDGPVLVNLFSDTVDSVGAEDGQIVTHGNFVVGYRSWSGDRHIEVSAPAELRRAVEYITAHVEEE